MQRQSAAAIRQSTTADELIRLNRDLLAVAEHARRNSRELVHRSSMGRIQRCLSGVHRNPFWALGMAEWVAGVRTHPPRGGGRTRGDGTFLSWRETNPGGRVHAVDADALIARNRALVALAKDACRWSRETAATAREARHVAKAMRDKNRAGYSAKTNAMRRQPPGDPAGKSFVISPRYVQSLQAEAAKIRARVQALVAAAKRSPPSETPD